MPYQKTNQLLIRNLPSARELAYQKGRHINKNRPREPVGDEIVDKYGYG
jgi:hypothetical protein